MFFHIDLDAFYAAVEVLDRPELAGPPLVIGAEPGRRGVVSTCSYEARAFGVHSAMPVSDAKRLCPDAVFLPVRMARYAEMSGRVMKLLENFTPDLLRVSIDEASLDMRGTERLWGAAFEAAALVQKKVKDELGLPVSVGIASNRYIAKIASGLQKPHGLLVVKEGEEKEFINSLRLKDLWGLGQKTRELLASFGVNSIAGLKSLSASATESILGKAGAAFASSVLSGKDPGIYASSSKTKSMSSETTFNEDLNIQDDLESCFLRISEELAARLWADAYKANRVSVKLRYGDFETKTAQESLHEYISSSKEIFSLAKELFYKTWNRKPLRLIGLSVSGLAKEKDIQSNLFEKENEKSSMVEIIGIQSAQKGLGGLTRARLLPRPERPEKPNSQKPS